MSIYQALGTGPVSFVDSSQNQKEVPLNQIFFTPNGIDLSASPLLTADGPVLYAMLQQMVAQGLIAPATTSLTSASLPSMIASAAVAGPSGNGITVAFSEPSATAGTVTIAVTATQVYAGLTPASLGATLGTTAATSGLVYVQEQNPADTMPPDAGFKGSITESAPTPLLVPDPGGDTEGAFTLAAATNATPTGIAWSLQIAIAIDPVPTPPPTPAPPPSFTVTVTWTGTTAAGVTLASLLTTNPFLYFVTFSGQAGPVPATSTITLAGGAAAIPATTTPPITPAVPATYATANVYASS
jgi:hypothetical protein